MSEVNETQETKKNAMFDLLGKVMVNPLKGETMNKTLEPWMKLMNQSVEQMTEVQKTMWGQWQSQMEQFQGLTQDNLKQMNTMMEQTQELFQNQMNKFRR